MRTLGREAHLVIKEIHQRVSDLAAQSIRAGPGTTHRYNTNSYIGRASEPLF